MSPTLDFFWKIQNELKEEIDQFEKRETLSEAERNQYDDALRNYRDNIAVLKAAINEGRAEGHAEGRIEGINVGTQNERIRIAQSLLSMNISEDFISQLTRLSSEQIQKLKS